MNVLSSKDSFLATKKFGSKRRTTWSWDDRDDDNCGWRPMESDVGRKASTKSAVTGKRKFRYGLEDRRLAAGLISNNNQLGKGDDLLNIEIAKAINHVHLSGSTDRVSFPAEAEACRQA